MRRAAPALALLLALAPRAALAAPSPDPSTLGAMLIEAPSGYVENGPGPDTVDGPFDAQSYVSASYSDTSEQKDIVGALNASGFLGGYGRTFQNVAQEAWIMEDVKAFPDNDRAKSYWRWEKGYFHDSSDPKTDVTVAIPDSFGNEYVVNGFDGIDIEFAKGAFTYSMVVGSYKGYMPADANAEALAEYEFAPAGDIPATGAGPSVSDAAVTGARVVVATTAGAVAALVLGAMVAMLVVTLRRRPDYSARNVLSVDGAYWWDGRAWQPTGSRR